MLRLSEVCMMFKDGEILNRGSQQFGNSYAGVLMIWKFKILTWCLSPFGYSKSLLEIGIKISSTN